MYKKITKKQKYIMAGKFIRKISIDAEKLQTKRGFKKIGLFLSHHPYLFGFQRRKFALGFALGIGFGVIPLPIQFLFSGFLCYIFKASIPGAFLATLLTNPLTFPFILAMAFFIGKVLHTGDSVMDLKMPEFSLLFSSPFTWLDQMASSFDLVGKILLTGLPLTGLLLGLFSYAVIRFGWYWLIVLRWKTRHKKVNILSPKKV